MSMDSTTQATPVSSTHTVEQGGFTFTSTDPIGAITPSKAGKIGGAPALTKPVESDDEKAAREAKEAEETGGGDAEKVDKADKVEKKPVTAAEAGKKGGEARAAIQRHKEREEQKAARERGEAPAPAPAKADKAEAGESPEDDDDESDPVKAGEKATKKVAAEIAAAPLGTKKQLASERVGEATREARQARLDLAKERQERERDRGEVARLRQEIDHLRRQVSTPQGERRPQDDRGQGQPPTNGRAGNGHAQPSQAYDGTDERDPEPQEDDPKYENQWNRYFADHTRWTARKEARVTVAQERAQAQHQQATHSYAQGVVAYVGRFEQRVREAIQADPDLANRIPGFQRVIENSSYVLPDGEKATAKHAINDAIIDSEHPALILEYLKSTPREVQRFLKLPNREAIAREMVRLEARLELLLEDGHFGGATAGTPPSKPEVSKASPPVRPVTGAPASVEELNPNLSIEEYAKRWDMSVKPKLLKR